MDLTARETTLLEAVHIILQTMLQDSLAHFRIIYILKVGKVWNYLHGKVIVYQVLTEATMIFNFELLLHK